MRLGVFGGTFDPPHVGHLLAAVDAFDALALDRLIFVPAAQQPLKLAGASADAAHRLAMVRMLVAGDARFEVDPVEIDRDGLSYTVDTLAAYATRFPDAERFFLVGADVLDSFQRWREPERVLALAQLVVLTRAGGPAVGALPVASSPGARAPLLLATRRVDVSSTEIRSRVAAGLPLRGFVPDDVASLIESAGLYR